MTLSYASNWGNLYGLKFEDLTDNQIKKIEVRKLAEFINQNEQVEIILGDSLLSATPESMLDTMNAISRNNNFANFAKFKYLNKKYNEYLVINVDVIAEQVRKHYHYNNRARYIRWDWLNNENKLNEIEKLSEGKSSVADESNIIEKIEWLFGANERLAIKFTSKILKRGICSYSYTYNCDKLIQKLDIPALCTNYPLLAEMMIDYGLRFVEKLNSILYKLPTDVYLALLPEMFENKNARAYALTASTTPDEYMGLALRAISGKTYIPTIRRNITVDMLNDLPPITRLKTIEARFYNSSMNKIINLTEEKLRHMLFASTIRYTLRVARLVKAFNNNYNHPVRPVTIAY